MCDDCRHPSIRLTFSVTECALFAEETALQFSRSGSSQGFLYAYDDILWPRPLCHVLPSSRQALRGSLISAMYGVSKFPVGVHSFTCTLQPTNREHQTILKCEELACCGMLRHVALVRTDVSEERSASFIRVTRIGELGTLAVTSNRHMHAS
jgi:hypothetical protein